MYVQQRVSMLFMYVCKFGHARLGSLSLDFLGFCLGFGGGRGGFGWVCVWVVLCDPFLLAFFSASYVLLLARSLT